MGATAAEGGTVSAKTVRTEVRTAKNPEAYVAEFGPDFTWGGKPVTVRLVEVYPGQTSSGRKRFLIEITTG